MLCALCVLATACDILAPGTQPRGLLWEVSEHVTVQPVTTDALVIAAIIGGQVKAFDKRDGSVRWVRNLQITSRARSLVRFEDLVIVPARDLIALDAATGAERWRYSGSDRQAGVLTPVLAGDTLFAGGYSSGEAVALNARTGELYWSVMLGNTIHRPTVTSAKVVFPRRSGAFDGAGAVIALDRASGEEQWRFAMPDAEGFPGGPATGGLSIGDRVIVGSRTAVVYALSESDGTLLWEYDTGATNQPIGTRLLNVNGSAVFQRLDGHLEALNPLDGSRVWQSQVGESAFEDFHYCAPYLCRAEGQVYVVNGVGEVVWQDGGGGPDFVFLSNVEVDTDGIMYGGIVRGLNKTRVIAFRPGVLVGPTTLSPTGPVSR